MKNKSKGSITSKEFSKKKESIQKKSSKQSSIAEVNNKKQKSGE